MGPTDRLYVELVANVGGFVTGMDRAAGSVQRVDASTGKVDKTLSKLQKGGLLALATGVGLVVDETLQLDTAMRNVNSISGMTEGALGATRRELVRMSGDAGAGAQKASVLAEGLYDIASSGFQGADGMKVLDASAVAASAGMTQTAVSAKAITAVLNAYKKPAEEAADVSDTLFSTVNLGVISFEQLSHNLGDYIGTAQSLGVSFDETGAAIATMTLNGITATQSGTALNSVLAKLIKPGEGLATVLHDLGYESGTAAIEALGLRGTLMAVNEATGGTAEGMSGAFDDINALRGALALTSGEGENYAAVSDKITDRTQRAGAAQEALAEQSKAVTFHLGLIRNQAVGAGVGLANMALPTVVDGLVAVQRGGQGAADVLGSIAGQLEGVFDSARTIGGDAVEILLDVAAAAAPLAELGGKMVVGGLVVSLELLTGLLEPLVGFLADNEVVATALAIALGIHLLSGVTALTTGVTVLATRIRMELAGALIYAAVGGGSMSGAVKAIGAALTSTAAVAAVATAGIGLGLASVAVGFQRASSAADSLRDAQDRLQGAEGLAAELEAMEDAGAAAARVLDRMDELASRDMDTWGSLFDVAGNVESIRLFGSETEQLARKQEAAARQADVFRTNVNALAERGFEPGSAAANRFHNEVVLSGQAFDEMLPLLEAAGVRTGDSLNVMAMKVEAYKAKTDSAAGAQDGLVSALDGVQSKAKTTEEAVEALSDALDVLIGVPLNAAKATIAFEGALDDLQAKLGEVDENGQRLGTTLDVNTQRGRDNTSSVIDAVGALKDKMEADAAAGAETDELSRTLVTGRERLVEQAAAAGLSRDKMIELLTQYGLTPDLVATVVEAVGTDTAVGKVKGVQKAIDDLSDKTVTVAVQYTSMGATRTVGTQGGLQEADGGVVSFHANGGVREQHVAQIAKGGEWRVWAEDETEGEAYIPLAQSKRGRSEAILADVADRFGYRLEAFADGGFSSATRDRVYGDAIDWITKHAPKIPAAAPGMGVAAMMAALRAVFPGLALISGLRPGAITATGRPSYHGMGRATDIPPRMDVFNHLASAYPNSTELIFSPAGGRQRYNGQPHVYSGVTKAMHYDHIHWAMAKGGILNPYVRDTGGPLRPGFTYNGTGRDEMVVPMATGGITGPIGRVTTRMSPNSLTQRAEDGSLVPAYFWGLEKAAKKMTDVTAIRDLTKAYDAYNDQLQEAARRVELVADHSEARRQYDAAKAVTARARAEAARLGQTKAQIAAQDQLANAQRRLVQADTANEKTNAKAAVDIAQRKLITTRTEAQAKATEKLSDALRDEGRARESYSGAIKSLKDFDRAAVIDKERAAVDRLIETLEKEQQVREEQQRAREEKLDSLNQMLDQERDVRARGVEAEREHAEKVAAIRERVAQAETDLQEQQQRLLDGRRDQLTAWARLDERAAVQWGNSVQQLLDNAQAQNAQFEQWSASLAEARAAGLSEQIISALGLDEGPQALGQLREFGQATAAEIDALNAEVARRTSLAGEQTAREQQAGYGELGRGLLAAHGQYVDALADLDEELVQAQADLLVQQAEVATQLAAIGQDQARSYGEALAAGLASQIPLVAAQAYALQKAAGGATANATMVNGQYTDTMTGRAAFVGPNGEPGYAKAQAPPGAKAHTMPDGRVAYYLPVKAFDSGGYLEPGYTLAFNGTGQREHIPNPRAGGSTADGGLVAVEVTNLTVLDGQVIDRRVETKLGTLKRASQAHRNRRPR